jgi:flagellar protein FliO/FliZ
MRWIVALIFFATFNVSAGELDKDQKSSESSVQSLSQNSEESNDQTADMDKNEVVQLGREADLAAKPIDKLKVDNRVESEIPLNLETSKKSANDGVGIFRILLTLSILGIVGTGAFVFIRKYSVPKDRKHQTQIKVLQQHFLGPKKSLAIIRVAGESILIGITDQNISMIKSLSLLDEDVPEESADSFNKVLKKGLSMENMTFSESSKSSRDSEQTALNEQEQLDALDTAATEQFAIKGIKDIVSKRLRGMRTF